MINCEICNQDFKSELGLEKHNITNKHATNFEIKVLKDDKISLQNENIQLHENILILSNKIENFKIESVQTLLEINKMKKLNNTKDKLFLQHENIELHENILILSNKIENFKIKAVQNLLEINEIKKLNNTKDSTITSLVSKVKILEDKQNYFNIFAIGGISFSIIIYLVKDNNIINLY